MAMERINGKGNPVQPGMSVCLWPCLGRDASNVGGAFVHRKHPFLPALGSRAGNSPTERCRRQGMVLDKNPQYSDSFNGTVEVCICSIMAPKLGCR